MPILPENDAFKIEVLSPAMARAVKDGLSPQDCAKIGQILELAAISGALRELDFVRESDTSYNPWPARIVQICIDEAKLVDLPPLAVALISCCKVKSTHEDIFHLIGGDILATAGLVNKIIEDLDPPSDDLSAPISMVIKVHLLDRGRQLHRASVLRRMEVIHPLCSNAEMVLKMYPSSDPVTTKLQYWLAQRAPLLKNPA